MRNRLVMLIVVFCLTSSILIGRLFYLQIIRGEDYLENYELQIRRTTTIPATRGNIYDRNGSLIAYNELAYSVTIEDSIPSGKDKNELLNAVLDKVLSIVESHGDSVISSFGITLNSSGEYQFTQRSETQRLRFVADVYGLATIDKLSADQKNQTAAEIIDYLCSEKRYDLDQESHDAAYILKMINMRYAMSLTSYSQYMGTTLASDVSDETAAAIMENKDSLTGVDISEESLRRYPDGEYFASIVGYTGQISQSEYDALSDEDKERYSLSDIVGKTGIEQTMDSVLQGTKGESTFYVDNLGKILDTVSRKEPEAGNDVYLTIDKDLQIYAYNLLEEKLAGIILNKLRNVLDYDPAEAKSQSDIIIPVGDAYNSFISNEIIDMDHFGSADAQTAERTVYGIFQEKKTSTLSAILSEMQNPDASAYRDLSEEMQAYMSYIVNDVLDDQTGLLLTDRIDTSDPTYTAWRSDESISLYTFLNYAITQNWIDTSLIDDSSYSSSEEIYQALVNYLQEYLNEDSDFDKLLYEYLIKSGSVSGAYICAITYEQGVLPMDESAYNGLLDGSVSAYSWLYSKIDNIEITPGQLALDPCSGGLVLTDPNTGDVLACVSYPGYDNNRLANTMDSAYYTQLNTGDANTFYNRATQELTAPGSTFKMVTSVAGLTEGVIDGGTYLSCNGPFTKVTPSPRCWIYPSGHGSLNITRALQVSCNNFFYEVGYRLGIDENGNYNSETGTDKLAKYAEMFGLGQKSGVEISESSPQISTEDSVRSAIGQGNSNYTVSQLNRYVTAVANRGTVYDLTLIDKTTDSNGKLIKDYSAEVINTMDEVSSTTWDLVQEGMQRMVANSSTFTGSGISMSGKTGTAQQSSLRSTHALFVGYAPSDSPEISIAIRIAYGYTSSYAAEVARDLVRIYFNRDLAGELITGTAADLGTAISGD
ncbi:penicillin-binding transpeptidase domain-containing protein [Lachnoclostridium sp. An169]|uniref:penicillin-binding transpeptidase domain-containing protein n=1 Tax=Lachnoclostridium sp. An169 TaxID=1965569 RepID=UPI000B38A618